MKPAVSMARFVIHLSLLCTLVACGDPGSSNPTVLRVSSLPDQLQSEVRARHMPLIDHVCSVVNSTSHSSVAPPLSLQRAAMGSFPW